MDFTEQLRLLEAAQGDPSQLALATLDIVLASQAPELRRVVEAAAVPHWFDEARLAALLDDDLRPDSRRWFQAVIVLPQVEPMPARQGFNIHETTRLALRRQIFAERPERFRALAARAAAAFPGPAVHEQIEHAYQLLLAEQSEDPFSLREFGLRLAGSVEALLALTSAIDEYARDPVWPPSARGWAFLLSAWNRASFRRNDQTAEAAAQALQAFTEAQSEWGMSLASQTLGDAAMTSGNLTEAERLFGDALRRAERVAASYPGNAASQRDLSMSLQRLGDLAVAQGNLPTAARHFAASLTIRERLAASHPANAQWQHGLSVTYHKLGDLAVAQGDVDAAARYFGKDLTIAARLAASDPANAAWQRDLSVSHIKLGNLAVAQGDLPAAERHFATALTITERLAVADPANAAWQRDLWVSYYRVANVLKQRGQPEAGDYWRKAYETLAGMKQAGVFLSEEDEGFLARLRAKTGG
jgi:tetratricopeptide (TPR) repeat protein